jgi:amidase
LRPQGAAAHDAFSGYDGIGQAQLVRSKQATALELVDSAIARIEAANPKLNAVVWEMFEHARTRAKGALPASPLTSVPYLIKDLNNVADERTTCAMVFSLSEDVGDYARLKPIGFVAGPSKRRLRIAFGTASYYGTEPHPDVKAAVEAGAKLCESLGHTVVPAQNPVDGQAFSEASAAVWSSAPAMLVRLAKSRNLNPENLFEPYTLELADYAMNLPPDALLKALAVFKETEAQVDAFMANYDAWLTPVLASPPVRLGELAPTIDFKTLFERVTHYVSYTAIHNVAGTPAMSVPLGMSQDGLPIGSQFAAAQGREDLLYALAYELEAAQPWASRTPKVWMG